MEIQVGAIILQMINFGVVVGALTFLLFKPVRRILDERARKIEEGLKASESALAKEAKLDKKAQEIELAAQEKAKSILDEARKDAQERQAELLAEAKQKAEEIISKARDEAVIEKQAIMADLQSQFEAAVVAVAAQVIGEEVSTKKHQALIKQSLKEIEAA